MTPSQIQAATAELGDLVANRAGVDSAAHRNRLHVLRTDLAKAFAADRGWKLTRHPFTIPGLARGRPSRHDSPAWPIAFVDHPFFFRRARVGPAGLVAHPYRRLDQAYRADLSDWARANHLAVSFPDFPSWWFPGQTSLVLFEPATAVQQATPFSIVRGGRT